MENLAKIWTWFKSITPLWLKLLIAVLASALILLVSMTGCSSPRSLIRVKNNADGTHTSITQSTGDGGSVSVQVSPKLEVSVDSTKLNFK